MRGVFHLAIAALFAAAMLPTSAAAQEAPSWNRVPNPDGSFSVEMPCTQETVQRQEDKGSIGMACWLGGLLIGAVMTTDGLGDGGPDAATDFEGMLAEARNDPDGQRVQVLPSEGARMFRAWKKTGTPFGVAQMIESYPGGMIVLAVMDNPEGSSSSTDRVAAEQIALRYFESFQASAK